MFDYVDLDSCPIEEECVQVQKDVDYLPAMREECKRYLELIRKKLGPEPPEAMLRIKSHAHDFGTYLSVICKYNTNDEEATAYAYACEEHSPLTWDDDKPVDWRKKEEQESGGR